MQTPLLLKTGARPWAASPTHLLGVAKQVRGNEAWRVRFHSGKGV